MKNVPQWVIWILVGIVGLVVGFAGGAVYTDDPDETTQPAPTTSPTSAEDVPVVDADRESCLAALDEAERSVAAEQRAQNLIEEYRDLAGTMVDAIRNLDTRQLERQLSELEDLNEEAQELGDETASEAPGALDTCRELIGVDEA